MFGRRQESWWSVPVAVRSFRNSNRRTDEEGLFCQPLSDQAGLPVPAAWAPPAPYPDTIVRSFADMACGPQICDHADWLSNGPRDALCRQNRQLGTIASKTMAHLFFLAPGGNPVYKETALEWRRDSTRPTAHCLPHRTTGSQFASVRHQTKAPVKTGASRSWRNNWTTPRRAKKRGRARCWEMTGVGRALANWLRFF